MLVTVNHLADLTALDRRTVARRLSPLPGKAEGHTRVYDSAAALRVLYGGTEGKLDPQEQRARLDKARADLAEMDLEVRRGQLVRAEVVAKTWSDLVTVAKSRLLAVPSRVAPELVNRDMRACEQVVRDAIHEALEDLSRDDDGGPTAVAKVD